MARTWIDEQPTDKLEAALETYRTAPALADVRRYAGEDERFGVWLAMANQRCLRHIAVSIFDLADYTWRDAYDSGEAPSVAVREALESDDTFSLLFRGE